MDIIGKSKTLGPLHLRGLSGDEYVWHDIPTVDLEEPAESPVYGPFSLETFECSITLYKTERGNNHGNCET